MIVEKYDKRICPFYQAKDCEIVCPVLSDDEQKYNDLLEKFSRLYYDYNILTEKYQELESKLNVNN